MKLKFLDKVLVRQGFYAGNFGFAIKLRERPADIAEDSVLYEPIYEVEFSGVNVNFITGVVRADVKESDIEPLDTRVADTTAKLEAEKAEKSEEII